MRYTSLRVTRGRDTELNVGWRYIPCTSCNVSPFISRNIKISGGQRRRRCDLVVRSKATLNGPAIVHPLIGFLWYVGNLIDDALLLVCGEAYEGVQSCDKKSLFLLLVDQI